MSYIVSIQYRRHAGKLIMGGGGLTMRVYAIYDLF